MDLLAGASPNLRGVVKVPPNKSHSFRALIMAALAEGTSRIVEPMVSNDWMRAVEALELLGANVEPRADRIWEVTGTAGQVQTPDDIIDCGNSGIILRFFMALAACGDKYTVLTGDHSLRHLRVCQPVIDAVNALGGWAISTKGDGHAPVVVRGRLRGGRAEIDGADSQPVSALLIASGLAEAPTELVVRNPGEKPWVGMTLDWLRLCGVEFSNENYQLYRIRGKSHWQCFERRIPLDWSSAMYPILAALITSDSEIRLPGLDINDSQGDKATIDVLRGMGADIQVSDDEVIARSSQLRGAEIDCNDIIDQLPVLAIAGAVAQGQTLLYNAAIARSKECDRIAETCKALRAMGANVEERPDGLLVRQSRLHGARINSQHDHRMVMSFAVAGLAASGQTVISDLESIRKTFPIFVDQMQSVGADIQSQ